MTHTFKTIGAILGVLIVLGGFIWQTSAYTTKIDYELQKCKDKNNEQDSCIAKIDGNVAYLVKQARLKEIIDSLSQSELVIKAQKIMENNNKDTAIDDTDTAKNVYSTDDINRD